MLRDAETTYIAERMRRSPLGGDAFFPPPRRRARFSLSETPGRIGVAASGPRSLEYAQGGTKCLGMNSRCFKPSEMSRSVDLHHMRGNRPLFGRHLTLYEHKRWCGGCFKPT